MQPNRPNRQMERDLSQKFDDDIYDLVRRHFDICETMGIERGAIIAGVLSTMAHFLVSATHAMGIPKAKLYAMLGRLYDKLHNTNN